MWRGYRSDAAELGEVPNQAGTDAPLLIATDPDVVHDGTELRLTVSLEAPYGAGEVDVAVVTTGTALGAGRAYFRCSGLPGRAACGARVGKLCWPLFGQRGFACRNCHDLAYRSSQERRRKFAELREQIFARAANDGRWLATAPDTS